MKIITYLIIIILISSCKLFEKEVNQKDVFGCMDSTATNYNPDATLDDGGCDYCKDGSSFLLISTDGGDSWDFNCPQDFNIGDVFQISIVDSENIWIASSRPEGDNYDEAIIYTSDKGKTWEVQFKFTREGTGAGIDQLIFTDENIGLIVVDETNVGPQFYRTNDSGKNWTKVQTPPTEGSLRNHERVDFVDHNSVFFINTSTLPRKFYGSTNLGAQWDTTHFSDAIHVEFYDKNIGLVVGHHNAYRTSDSGKSWEEFPLNFLENSEDIYWGHGIRFSNSDANNVWLLDNRNIRFSSDTGRTWISYPIEISYPDMYLYNNKAWITGWGSYKYSDNARTGVWLELDFPSNLYPIKMWPETIGGYKDGIIVMSGEF